MKTGEFLNSRHDAESRFPVTKCTLIPACTLSGTPNTREIDRF